MLPLKVSLHGKASFINLVVYSNILPCKQRYYMKFKPSRNHIFHAIEYNVSLICTASRMRLCFSSQSEPGIWTYIYASLTNKENMMSILRRNTIYKYKLFNHQNVPEINFILHFLCFNVEKNCNFSMGRFVFFECTEHITKVVYGMLYTTSITV